MKVIQTKKVPIDCKTDGYTSETQEGNLKEVDPTFDCGTNKHICKPLMVLSVHSVVQMYY